MAEIRVTPRVLDALQRDCLDDFGKLGAVLWVPRVGFRRVRLGGTGGAIVGTWAVTAAGDVTAKKTAMSTGAR